MICGTQYRYWHMEGEGREKRFIEWFLNNGGLFRGVKQARFEPNSYTGIAADEDIPKNTIVIAVPKNLIIGVERVRGSELGSVLQESPIFGGEDNDDKDFNVLALFLVMEKMKGARSFFAPYLDCIDIAETLVYWPPGDVALLGDPFLTPSFLREVANDFEPTFHTFAEIAERHPALFAERLTRELFDKCYGVVMTRCFGWGLPETMLVPFADLLNHHSNGVHHYAFSASLERRPHPDYVPKGDCLSLALFGIDNARRLPRAYEKDSRELYIEAHRDLLRAKGIPLEGDVRDLPNATARQCLQAIRSHRARESFEAPLLLSSDSEDNDSLEDEDEAVLEQIKDNPHARRFYEAKTHFRRMRQAVEARRQQRYVEPKPSINREFEEDVSFQWWYEAKDAQFIVATARNAARGEQLFNSYGRRSNRFLLLWYGFTFPGNKYDSVPFRLWSPAVRSQTGKVLFARYLTEKDWRNRIPVGNERYSYTELSEEFRLKLPELDYCLLAFLRLRLLLTPVFSQFEPTLRHLVTVCDLSLEVAAFGEYLEVLGLLAAEYRTEPAEGFSSRSRQYFANVLIESDSRILEAHFRGVRHVLGLLSDVREGKVRTKEDVGTAYRESWSSDEEESQARNRVFVAHYYHLLSNHLS